jgi:hypothetical protein
MPKLQTHKFRVRKLITLSLVAMGLQATAAHAEDTDTPMFLFSGFGTLGLVHSSENRADFTSDWFRPNGAGYSHAWSADVDSRIGAQVTGQLTQSISAVVQVISEQRYNNSYLPTVEWANIKYQFTPDLSIRVGRIALPTFLVSDYRKVGYANSWVRPPGEVYNLAPYTNSDGVDGSYRAHFGEFTNTVQGTYGSSESKFPAGDRVTAQDMRGISDTVEFGSTSVHIAYFKTNVTIEALKPLYDGFRRFGPEGIALADKYLADNKPFTFVGLGASYNPGGWFVTGEWSSATTDSILGDSTAWYASGGYCLDKFTPYLAYAQVKRNSNTSDPGLTLSTLPPSLVGPATDLNAALNVVLGSFAIQKTITVGTRWDFMKNTDLKLQFEYIRIGAGSNGVLVNIQPGYKTGGKVNVFSATIDFVF